MKEMLKPTAQVHDKPAYAWSEVEEWVGFKTDRSLQDWAGKFSKKHEYDPSVVYQDMWHWICDINEIHNGCYFYLNLDDDQIDDADKEHLFICEILAVLREEFPEAEGEMYCYVTW